jgi:hypothetical protein
VPLSNPLIVPRIQQNRLYYASTTIFCLRLTMETLSVVLVLFYFSAAIDHGILLRGLESRIGIRKKALEWMESYVTGRHQAVLIDGYVSSHVPLRYVICGM